MRKMAPLNPIVYCPVTEKGRAELARCVSDAHASTVNQRLKSLNCPKNRNSTYWKRSSRL